MDGQVRPSLVFVLQTRDFNITGQKRQAFVADMCFPELPCRFTKKKSNQIHPLKNIVFIKLLAVLILKLSVVYGMFL